MTRKYGGEKWQIRLWLITFWIQVICIVMGYFNFFAIFNLAVYMVLTVILGYKAIIKVSVMKTVIFVIGVWALLLVPYVGMVLYKTSL